jgi:hypothetical protein
MLQEDPGYCADICAFSALHAVTAWSCVSVVKFVLLVVVVPLTTVLHTQFVLVLVLLHDAITKRPATTVAKSNFFISSFCLGNLML